MSVNSQKLTSCKTLLTTWNSHKYSWSREPPRSIDALSSVSANRTLIAAARHKKFRALLASRLPEENTSETIGIFRWLRCVDLKISNVQQWQRGRSGQIYIRRLKVSPLQVRLHGEEVFQPTEGPQTSKGLLHSDWWWWSLASSRNLWIYPNSRCSLLTDGRRTLFLIHSAYQWFLTIPVSSQHRYRELIGTLPRRTLCMGSNSNWRFKLK